MSGTEETEKSGERDRTRALVEAAIAIARSETVQETLDRIGEHAKCLVGTPWAVATLFEDAGEPAKSSLVVAMRDRHCTPIGILQVSGKSEGPFSPEDEGILVQLAQMGAASIENVRLREALEAANQRERERNQEIEALMDALPVAVWIAHDSEAKNITGNRASFQILRSVPDSVVSKSAEEDAPTHFRVMRDGRELRPDELPVQQAAKHGVQVTDFEEQIVFDDGLVRTVFGNVTPLFDGAGNPRGAVAAFVDVTLLKETERELRRATTKYRALAEAAASVVFTADSEGQLTSLPLLRGHDPIAAPQGVGHSWLRSIHPDDRNRAMERWQSAIASREPYDIEFRIQMVDGEYRWHVARSVFVPEDSDQPGQWIGACVDVHDRVTIERELSLLNVLSAATRAARTPTEVISVTQRLLGEYLKVTRCAYGEPIHGGRAFEMPPNYCVGCEDLTGRFPLSGFDSNPSQSLRAGRTLILHDVANELAPEDGRDAYLGAAIAAAVCVPLVKDGRSVAMLGIHQDRPRTWSSDEIDLVRSVLDRMWSELERVRAGDAVLRSEQRLRQTLEAATVGVALNDVEGRFLYANQPMLRMLGYGPEDVESGRLCWNLIQVPDRRDKDDEALEQLRASGTCAPYETEFLTKDGSRVPVYVGAAIVPDTDGSGFLGAAFVTDLSALKEAERELVRLNADLERRVRERTNELEAANREMEGFNYTVAHDLRGPLRSIVSTARILEEEAGPALSAENRRLLERQAINATHLARLLDDLLVYSRIARLDVKRERVNVSELAHRVAESACESRLNDVQIEEGLEANADPSLLRLVLQNLLENACKFSPGGGPVTLGRRGNAIFVQDSGVGFDMAHARKLFEPFERLVRQDEFPGTGIGLANVKRVVERHGGQIWADSRPGAGAIFWFTLQPDTPQGV